jgi:hypothetical protein
MDFPSIVNSYIETRGGNLIEGGGFDDEFEIDLYDETNDSDDEIIEGGDLLNIFGFSQPAIKAGPTQLTIEAADDKWLHEDLRELNIEPPLETSDRSIVPIDKSTKSFDGDDEDTDAKDLHEHEIETLVMKRSESIDIPKQSNELSLISKNDSMTKAFTQNSIIDESTTLPENIITPSNPNLSKSKKIHLEDIDKLNKTIKDDFKSKYSEFSKAIVTHNNKTIDAQKKIGDQIKNIDKIIQGKGEYYYDNAILANAIRHL